MNRLYLDLSYGGSSLALEVVDSDYLSLYLGRTEDVRLRRPVVLRRGVKGIYLRDGEDEASDCIVSFERGFRLVREIQGSWWRR